MTNALPEPLTRHEFANAIKRGQGRAWLQVRYYGLDDIADLVLNACLNNLAYDAQCELRDSGWLFDMFSGAPEYPHFSASILSRLVEEAAKPENEFDFYNVEHLCGLAAQMGRNGNETAGTTLRNLVLGQDFTQGGSVCGCKALVLLDGVQAVVELAHRYGSALLMGGEAMDALPTVAHLTDGLALDAEVNAALAESAKGNAAIAAFIKNEQNCQAEYNQIPERTDEEREKYLRERARSEYSLEKILASAESLQGYNYSYRRFGRYATNEELCVVLGRLVAEPENEICRRLLWVFWETPMPEIPSKIWTLIESSDILLRYSARKALAGNVSARVGDFARLKLRSPDFSEDDLDFINIFVKNYEMGDVGLILFALKRMPLNDDQLHAMAILRICEENFTEDENHQFSQLLQWAYDTNPCSICRRHILEWLVDIGGATEMILQECRHDASLRIRAIAQAAAETSGGNETN